jgi:hypothetical protein
MPLPGNMALVGRSASKAWLFGIVLIRGPKISEHFIDGIGNGVEPNTGFFFALSLFSVASFELA